MNETQKCCDGSPKMIFPCSGAADLGEIADRVARRLTKTGVGKMFCLAGVGGRVDEIVTKAKSASIMLAIDGCDFDCAKKTLELAGFNNVKHVRITDLGLEKGSSPPTHENMGLVLKRAEESLTG